MPNTRTRKEIAEIEKIFSNKNKKKSIESLSGIVFGIALSIGTFSFIISDFKLVASNIITFAFSFFVLIYIWMRYTKALEILKVETNLELVLNILMLFLVVIEPYLFNQVQLSAFSAKNLGALSYTSYLFSVDIAGLMFVLAAIYMLALRDYSDIRKEVRMHYDHVRNSLLIVGGILTISALPFFWDIRVFGVEARFILWFVAAIEAMALRFVSR